MSPTRRIMILALSVVGLALLAWLLPMRSLQPTVAALGPAAPLLGVLLGAALLVALVPRTPVSLACGLLFGALVGAACALALALLAAGVTFAAGRWLGRDFIAARAGRRWQWLEARVARSGILAVAAVRCIPLGPYGLTGYAYGASAVPVRDYAWGTAIAATPSAVSYALLGAAVAGERSAGLLSLAPLALGLALSLTLVVRQFGRQRAG